MSRQLKKQITLYSLTMIAVGSSIGSGIFRTPSEIAGYLPTAGWMLAVWVAGGMVALCGALTFAEIASMFPKAGGFYVFLKEAFGELPAFLYSWSMLLVINTGSLAALTLVFTSYLNELIPMPENAQLAVAVFTIALLTIMNVLGVKWGGVFASVFTSAKLIGIAIVVCIGFVGGTYALNMTGFAWTSNVQNLSLVSSFGLALIGVTFSYGGYQHATFLAAEVKDANRMVPRAMLMGIGIVCLAYLSVNVAYLKLLPIERISTSTGVASEAVSTVWGLGAKFISFLIVLSVLGTIGIYILTAPRIYFAMAQDGLFFKQFGEIHPRYQTPFWAIIFQSFWTILLLIFWKTFSNLITYVVFVDTLFFFLTAAAIFKFRQRKLKRNYSTLAYPITPLIFMALSAFVVVNTLIEKPEQAWAGLFFLGLGGIAYVYFKWKRALNSKK
ncbi:APC family permease [Runella slithyformis]|uniref:Amino acid permease-associated region n=1 Tax=Runella slithyformis (strain ATCC 29530 / DSM 19594 / LMG 11500 / NCIMB 11436 / LSU 4) TaxID=761193 RepID=A0A7U4E6S1_RUNSL|nr:amino acid permease [Runella slithyformis]AEI49886.1 amino acid permease-associated region [Runella slithyformis DSM 19594]